MTENEAKTKWCPMVRFVVFPDGKIESNHPVNHNNTTVCIASACMMWRRTDYGKMHGINDGYCGLAGNPVAVVP